LKNEFKSWPKEFWRVNSYSYPCYFSDNDKAQEAWSIFLSFFDYTAYDEIKDYWDSDSAPRRLNPSALESWKATFEEVGLLYVISRSNTISITPSGHAIKELADSDNVNGFVWTGINLLIRYPLRGPRRVRSELHGNSDLFLYRFIFSAILELDNYLWWSELERVLCRVFSTDQTLEAIADIKALRADPSRITEISLPASQRKGAFYNSLNQVCNHASMNHLLIETMRDENPYKQYLEGESDKRLNIRAEWLPLIKKALISDAPSALCSSGGSRIAALPKYQTFDTEQDYFNFLGAPVADIENSGTTFLGSINLNGELVVHLEEGDNFTDFTGNSISGPQTSLCQLAKLQRVILDTDKRWTYLVTDKKVVSPSHVTIQLSKARPITDYNLILKLLES
jgi:hypothetical protein